ncbi:MAG: 3D domain-containing protein [Clostridia bacterium]|nr:3D domain-containing protein [Clostridia bacterium]
MIPLAKNIKRYFSLKEFIVVAVAIVFSITVGVGVFQNLKKEVVINDNGKTVILKTMKNTVGEVLEQNGTRLSSDDFISLPLGAKLQKIRKNEIYIKRAIPIFVTVDGQEHKIMTYRDTVKDALVNSPLKLTDMDRLVGASFGDLVSKDMKVKVVRVREELISEKTAIAYKTLSRENNHLDKGKQVVVKDGKEGIREKKFRVVFEDGKEVLKELLKDSIIMAPINQIVEFGTIMNFKTSRGDVVRYKKEINMRATAYTASFADTGKHPGDPGFGITYTGVRAKRGIIAVDPKVIPLGTKVYIEGVGNTPDYGFAVAADIGSAIKGNKIDLYFDDSGTVDRWGVRKVKVYILTE